MSTVTESHRCAIRTKYLGPTDSRGSRIRVWRADSTYRDDPHAITVPWDYAVYVGENHAHAIAQYVTEAGWTTSEWGPGRWVVGGGQDGNVAVWATGEGDSTLEEVIL